MHLEKWILLPLLFPFPLFSIAFLFPRRSSSSCTTFISGSECLVTFINRRWTDTFLWKRKPGYKQFIGPMWPKIHTKVKIIQKYTLVFRWYKFVHWGLFFSQFYLVSIEKGFRSTSVGQIRVIRDLGKLEAVKRHTMCAYLVWDSGDRVWGGLWHCHKNFPNKCAHVSSKTDTMAHGGISNQWMRTREGHKII